MNSETKTVGIIGIITIIVIAGGLYFASKNSNNTNEGMPAVVIKADALVHPDSPRLTGKNAKVQIVEFGDLECPACAVLHPELKKLLDTDGDNIDFVFRFIPIHQYSKESAAAALAAGEQGKFFEMFDTIYDHQDEWSAYGANYEKFFDSYATQIGLDMNKYHADLATNSAKYSALVDRDAADASAMNINSTPTLVINGKTVVRGAYPYAQLKVMVDTAASDQTATSTK